jgi:hypothetical protein
MSTADSTRDADVVFDSAELAEILHPIGFAAVKQCARGVSQKTVNRIRPRTQVERLVAAFRSLACEHPGEYFLHACNVRLFERLYVAVLYDSSRPKENVVAKSALHLHVVHGWDRRPPKTMCDLIFTSGCGNRLRRLVEAQNATLQLAAELVLRWDYMDLRARDPDAARTWSKTVYTDDQLDTPSWVKEGHNWPSATYRSRTEGRVKVHVPIPFRTRSGIFGVHIHHIFNELETNPDLNVRILCPRTLRSWPPLENAPREDPWPEVCEDNWLL